MSDWTVAGTNEKLKSMWKLPDSMHDLFRRFPHAVVVSERHSIPGSSKNTTEILYWATERFGPRLIAVDRIGENVGTECRWVWLGPTVLFANSDEALEFKLRWG